MKHAIPEWDSRTSSGHPHMTEGHYGICDGTKGATAAHKKTCRDLTLFADITVFRKIALVNVTCKRKTHVHTPLMSSFLLACMELVSDLGNYST